MLKRTLVGIVAICAMSVVALAQPTSNASLTIGSGDGSIAVNLLRADGYISGDTGLFNPAGATPAANTIWRNDFCIYDVTNAQAYYADAVGTRQRLTENSFTSTATNMTSGLGFASSPGLTAGLVVDLTQPAATTPQLDFEWTFNNAGGSPIDVRVVWFLDIDSYLVDGSYTNDLVAATIDVAGHTELGTTALAVGENDGGGNVNLLNGALMECDAPAAPFFGLSAAAGGYAGDFWLDDDSGSGDRLITVVEAGHQIDPSQQDTVENDADVNYLADAVDDAGGAMQASLTVPAAGSNSVTFRITWGINDTVGGGETAVSDWTLY